MSACEADGPTGPSAGDLERVLSLVYQCPIGMIVIDDDGAVESVNPAAIRMLGPALAAGEGFTTLYPLLQRLAPPLVELIRADPQRLGRLDAGRRVLVPAGGGGHDWRELVTTRVDPGRVLIVTLDVSRERRLAEREHRIAVELQAAMLGRIDPVDGLPTGVVYRPAESGLDVGGDWYDIIELDAQRVALVVGDVVGHDLHAAAVMGQLRSAVRAMAPSCTDPAQLLTRADRFAAGVSGASCTTLAYATLDRVSGELDYACAGHPPPLVIGSGGDARLLHDGRSAPLATGLRTSPRRYARAPLAPGSTVVLYTDGLVERRGEVLDTGLDRLLEAARGLYELDPGELSVGLADRSTAGIRREDDLCVLAARFEPVATRVHGQVEVRLESAG